MVLIEFKSQIGVEGNTSVSGSRKLLPRGSEMRNGSTSQRPFNDSDDMHVGLRTTGLDL